MIPLSLSLSHSLHVEMEAMARDGQCDLADVVARGLAMLVLSRKAVGEGLHVGVCDTAGMLDLEFVGF